MELDIIRRIIEEMKFKIKRGVPNTRLDVENYIAIVEALEKQVPKEIEIYDYGKAHCPVCKTDIHGIGKIKYCFHCGQKMDWNR